MDGVSAHILPFSEERVPVRSSRYLGYLGLLALAPVLLFAGTLVWMSSPLYMEHAPYAYLPETGYGLRLHGADCQVVVFGDSAALVGVDPRQVRDLTGFSTCNIADIGSLHMVTGLFVLDEYLKQNAKPRYIVFLFTPEDLNDPAGWDLSPFEGLLFRLQYLHGRGLAEYARRNPGAVLKLAEFGFRTGVAGLMQRSMPREQRYAREISGGRLPWPGTVMTSCNDFHVQRPPDKAWLAKLRERYAGGGTKVLIDAMPEPPCDLTFGYYKAAIAPGTVDNEFGSLPVGVFTNSGHLHVTDAGAQRVSQQIANQIDHAENSGNR